MQNTLINTTMIRLKQFPIRWVKPAFLLLTLCSFIFIFDLENLGWKFSREIVCIYDHETVILPNYIPVPPEFHEVDIWRPSIANTPPKEDRLLLQWEWIRNVRNSVYWNSIRSNRKKRILVTGFLREVDQGNAESFPCLRNAFNLGDYCEITRGKGNLNLTNVDALLIRRDSRATGPEPCVPPGFTVFFTITEPPWILLNGDFRVNNPVLASYWRGSDIVIPYHKYLSYEFLEEKPPTLNSKNYLEGKTKIAAIVVSDCKTPNGRLQYVEELQKYMEVDIYGKCGDLICSEGGKCFPELSKEYKFYLAFENCNCRDYITEKFNSNGLGHDWIPVALGAHPDDYAAIAPPNSYILVEDFPTPKDLADYLHIVGGTETLYNSYFKWRQLGKVVYMRGEVFCRVCAYLHYTQFNPNRTKWPDNAYHLSQMLPCLNDGETHWKNESLSVT